MKTSSLGVQDCEVLHCRNVEKEGRDYSHPSLVLYLLSEENRPARGLVNQSPRLARNHPFRG